MNGLAVLKVQSGHEKQNLSPYWGNPYYGDVLSPYVIRGDNTHAYMTMCDNDYTSESDSTAPPPYTVKDTKKYFTNIHNYMVAKHSTVV